MRMLILPLLRPSLLSHLRSTKPSPSKKAYKITTRTEPGQGEVAEEGE